MREPIDAQANDRERPTTPLREEVRRIQEQLRRIQMRDPRPADEVVDYDVRGLPR